jgi:hypothetical protein
MTALPAPVSERESNAVDAEIRGTLVIYIEDNPASQLLVSRPLATSRTRGCCSPRVARKVLSWHA